MKRLPVSILLLALVAVIPTGCENPSKVLATGLKVELTGIERTGDGAVSVSWRIENTNIVAYLLSRVSHKIYLNGTNVGTIVDEEPMGVPANSKGERTSKLKLADRDTASRLLTEAVARGSAVYRMDTQLVVRIYDESVERAALSASGTVPVTAK
jgi:LEA14-like dessication related protein